MRHNTMRGVLAILSFVLVLTIAIKSTASSDSPPMVTSEAIEQDIAYVEPVVISEMAVTYSPAPIKEPIVKAVIEEPVEEEIWPYPISQEEIDLIALVTMAEAESETELGKRLVIDTILNRVDDPHFPDTVNDVIYYPNAFSVMWNGRIDRCCVMDEIVELVKEELLERTNYECVFFTAGGYSAYGVPMFQECCHYFSSYD